MQQNLQDSQAGTEISCRGFAVMELPLVEFITVEFSLVVPDKFGRF